MAARAKTLLLLLAAVCLPAFAHVPHASLVVPKPHQGVERLAQASHRGPGPANALNATGLSSCLCDEGGRSRSTAKERDDESGLDYFGARYMSASLGRFTSADLPFVDQYTSDPQSWNLFGYVRNNPLRFFDPTGRKCIATDDGQTADDGEGTACQAVVEADPQQTTVYAYPQLDPLVALALRSAGDQATRDVKVIASEIAAEARDTAMLAAIPPVGLASIARRGKRITELWTATQKFSRFENALVHWKKHGSNFPGLKTASEYVKAANSFVSSPPAGTFTKVRANGDVVLYNPFSNTFAVKTADGVPRTYFKPDPAKHGQSSNWAYFQSQ